MSGASLVVLAAGMGSRFGGVKQVEAVGPSGETLLEYSVFDALRAGFDGLRFVIRREIEADFRERVLSRLPPSLDVALVFQDLHSGLPDEEADAAAQVGRSKPWGTVHAVLCACRGLDRPFAVVNADDFYGAGAFRAVRERLSADAGTWCLAGYRLDRTTSPQGSVARGVCVTDTEGWLLAVKERLRIREAAGEAAPARTEGGASAAPAGFAGLGAAGAAAGRSDGASAPRFVAENPDGSLTPLSGTETVSMNFWGFQPDFATLAEPLFRRFLEAHRGSATAELPLPVAIDDLLGAGKVRVSVLPTEDAWFGLTWSGDLRAARARMVELVERGVYPSPLWG